MNTLRLTRQAFRNGIWQGVLEGAGASPPDLTIGLGGEALGPAQLTAIEGQEGAFTVHATIPAAALGEGVHTFTISTDGRMLAHFTIMTGDATADDLRAQLGLLREELDLLKRAFRRHCRAGDHGPGGGEEGGKGTAAPAAGDT